MSPEHILALISQYGYAAIILLLMLGIVGLPIPDETLLTLTGYLIFRGTLHAAPGYLSALLGSCCGITISYAIGRYGGLRLIRRFGKIVHLSGDHLDRAKVWFYRHGKWALPAGYFVPGIRHVIAIIAGSSGLEYRRFAVLAYTGAAIWSGVFIGAGMILGREWERFPGVARTAAVVVFALALVAAAGTLVVRKIQGKRRVRRGAH